MIIKGFNVVPLVKKTLKEIGEDRIPSLAAETAYYFFFSLFPLLLFLTPLLGLVGNGRELMEALLSRLATTLPPDALSLLRRTLTEIITTSGGAGIMSIGALLAGWSGSSIFGALMDALNVAYDVSETRPWWKRPAAADRVPAALRRHRVRGDVRLSRRRSGSPGWVGHAASRHVRHDHVDDRAGPRRRGAGGRAVRDAVQAAAQRAAAVVARDRRVHRDDALWIVATLLFRSTCSTSARTTRRTAPSAA